MTSETFVHLNADDLDMRAAYKLLAGTVTPRPIAWVSTYGADGTPNAAPFSFFTVVSVTPPMVCFAATRRSGRLKDTAENIRISGSFVVNVVTEVLAPAMAITAGEWEPEIDEFALAHLTLVPGVDVHAPRIAESPIQMECKRVSAIEHGEPPGSYLLIIGRVTRFHVRADLLDDGRIEGLRALGRLFGDRYCTTDRELRFPVPTVRPASGNR